VRAVIHPDGCKCEDCSKGRELQRAEYKKWRDLYNSNPELKTKADDIHHHHLMGGDACCQCIEMAANQMGLAP
jgi:hypothetical protein